MIRLSTAAFLGFFASSCFAFAPQPFLTKAIASAAFVPASIYPDGASLAEPTHIAIRTIESTLLVSDEGIVDILRNVAIAVTAVIFLLAGLTFLVASVIVPAAAKELEKECKELAPELWDEYQTRLEPGETIDRRPDLMQELGAKLQPLLDAKIANQFADAKEKGIDVSEDEAAWNALDKLNTAIPVVPPQPPSGTSPEEPKMDLSVMNQWDEDDDSPIDVEIESKETNE